MKTITVEIAADGAVTLAVSGLRGRACREATAGLESRLGKVAVRRDTPEARLAEPVSCPRVRRSRS